MLFPQSNPFRQALDLSGLWEIRFDPGEEGEGKGWASGFSGGRPIAVPASWNEQLADARDNLGPAWYQTRFDRPWSWEGCEVRVRFGSVNYLADVWLNGAHLGRHEGGHLPFALDLGPHLRPEGNLLVVRVDGRLAPDRVPPGNITRSKLDAFDQVSYPDANFDFFPFCGIQRPVLLTATPPGALADLTVVTELDGGTGLVRVRLDRADDELVTAHLTLRGHGAMARADLRLGPSGEATLTVPGAALWAPGSPNRYALEVELRRGGAAFDRYTLPVGIRTVRVEGDRLLLNGEPVTLRGFGRHEDFPVLGRGISPAVMVKDYELMRWTGANSFRTTHYPYAEEQLELADRLGFLVISETAAVGLFFAEEGLARRQELCRQYTRELIARDKNRPSVIMWSLANEPHAWRPDALPHLRELCDLARELDPTRPATVVAMADVPAESLAFSDVICLNRYYGWYSQSGRLDEACARLSAELDAVHARFGRPIILAEFGADTIPGHHAEPPEMFSEEFQAAMLESYIKVLDSKPYVVGQHVWNLCDFKTGQAVHRMGSMNYKGVFTRDRRPKLAAHQLRALWGGAEAPPATD